ncbi:MAG TPA: GGDEF domain-containing protein, partial [Catenuloplanes sp.]
MAAGSGMPARRWPRLAVWALVVSVATVCGFTLWTVRATARATGTATAAAALSEQYQQAARAVGTEEALERKYRLDPSPTVRLGFRAAAGEMVAALDGIDRWGTAGDRRTAARIRALHAEYVTAVADVFAAGDRGVAVGAGALDEQRADPLFHLMQPVVVRGAAEHRDTANAALRRMAVLQGRASYQIPLVFVGGMLLAGLAGGVLRRYLGQLDAQRRQAVTDAQHDRLTGLPNRALLAARLDAAVRRDSGARRGVLLLDLDRFQDINDALGHEFGDRLLTEVAGRLTATLRDGDTVARLGGDEFAVLLPEVADLPAALHVAGRLRAAAELPVQLDGISLDIEASIGVAVSEPGSGDASALLRRAEVAMYVAKRHKRGI